MLSEINDINEITYISAENEGEYYSTISPKIKNYISGYRIASVQVKSMQTKGIINKVAFHWGVLRANRRIINYINNTDCDFAFFTSNGQLPFWLSVLSLKKPYVVSAISLKWIYDKFTFKHFLYAVYKNYFKKASLIFITEQYFQDILTNFGIKKIEVLNDRYLTMQKLEAAPPLNDILTLLTLGTISDGKNPIAFLESLRKINFHQKKAVYKIYGKCFDNTKERILSLIKDMPNVDFDDEYIEDIAYKKLMQESDFIVIPYDYNYTKYATSGVMWDCFEKQKPIICPDSEPFRYYIKQYNVGFLYNEDSLDNLINNLVSNFEQIKTKISQNYSLLVKNKTYDSIFQNFSSALQKINAV